MWHHGSLLYKMLFTLTQLGEAFRSATADRESIFALSNRQSISRRYTQ